MDPLSSLGVAGTAIQFVHFVASLLSNTRAIYNSAAGLSSEGELLDTIYGKLSSFSSKLGAEAASPPAVPKQSVTDDSTSEEPPHPKKSSNDTSIAELAKICKADCDSLLGILEKIKRKSSSGPRWWKSFQAALLEVTKADEVKVIKERIDKTQTSMIFYLCLASR